MLSFREYWSIESVILNRNDTNPEYYPNQIFLTFLMLIAICMTLLKGERRANTLPSRWESTLRPYFKLILKVYSKIKFIFQLSKATCSRLKKSDDSLYQGSAIDVPRIHRQNLSEEATLLITNLVEPQKSLIVVEDFQQKLFEILSEYYSDIIVRKYLRKVMKYSFK